MTAQSISSTGMSAHARSSTVAVASPLGTTDYPVWHDRSLSAAGETRSGTSDTVTLPKESLAADSTPAGKVSATKTNRISQRETPRSTDGVVFVYNFRGDLRIKFMDSFNNLVYQTPPEFLTHLSDIIGVSPTELDTTV